MCFMPQGSLVFNSAPIPLFHALVALVLGTLVLLILIVTTVIYVRLGRAGIKRLCLKGNEDIHPTMAQHWANNYALALESDFELIDRSTAASLDQRSEIGAINIAQANRRLATSPASQNIIVQESERHVIYSDTGKASCHEFDKKSRSMSLDTDHATTNERWPNAPELALDVIEFIDSLALSALEAQNREEVNVLNDEEQSKQLSATTGLRRQNPIIQGQNSGRDRQTRIKSHEDQKKLRSIIL